MNASEFVSEAEAFAAGVEAFHGKQRINPYTGPNQAGECHAWLNGWRLALITEYESARVARRPQ